MIKTRIDYNDILGNVYGDWTVLSIGNPIYRKDRQALEGYYYVCQCSCGVIKEIRRSTLVKGESKSCGCKRGEKVAANKRTHGKTDTPLYKIFRTMWARCYYTKCRQYKNYGARGITICKEWLDDYDKFHDWAISNGYAKGLSIDRIDCNSGYDPCNCRFITMAEQQSNKRSTIRATINGEQRLLKEWCIIYNVPYDRVKQRIKKFGWDIEQALSRPSRKASRYHSI